MARSQQTFSKKEKEKKRLKRREDKAKKKEARKSEKGGGIPFAYVDQFGNLSDTPPDPTLKVDVEVDATTINLDYSKQEVEVDPIRKGKVAFFDTSKGYGFITDLDTQEKYFTHVSGLIDQISENDKVTFELEKGMKGMNAVRVKKA